MMWFGNKASVDGSHLEHQNFTSAATEIKFVWNTLAKQTNWTLVRKTYVDPRFVLVVSAPCCLFFGPLRWYSIRAGGRSSRRVLLGLGGAVQEPRLILTAMVVCRLSVHSGGFEGHRIVLVVNLSNLCW